MEVANTSETKTDEQRNTRLIRALSPEDYWSLVLGNATRRVKLLRKLRQLLAKLILPPLLGLLRLTFGTDRLIVVEEQAWDLVVELLNDAQSDNDSNKAKGFDEYADKESDNEIEWTSDIKLDREPDDELH